MVESIEKLFNEMLNQILSEKKECKQANNYEFEIDKLMNELACTKDKLRKANELIVLLHTNVKGLHQRYENSLHENDELKNQVKLLSKLLILQYNNG